MRRIEAAPTQGLVCSCRHLESEHGDGGPCAGLDSYSLPCECPSLEVDRHWSGLDMPAEG